MLVAALLLALVAALVHVGIFTLESVLFTRPDVYTRFATHTEDVPAVEPWAFNQGFANLFLAGGTLVGVVLGFAGHEDVGLALVLFGCGSMLAAALVLVGSQREMARAAAIQGAVPLLAVAAGVVSLAI